MLTREQIRTRATDLGFLACGFTDLSPNSHGDALDRWLKAGYGGTMRYLNRQARKRREPARIDARARSAIVCMDCYYYETAAEGAAAEQAAGGAAEGTAAEGKAAGIAAEGKAAGGAASAATPRFKIARYARGEDYHRVTLRRLDLLGDLLRDHGSRWTRSFTDSGPLPERELAQRAGLGWIGKNTMLIRPGEGSWFVLGTVLTDLVLEPDAPFATDHCGTCTRCLDACPTGAFVEPRVLDATRCISYQTIEYAGPIDPGVAERLNGWIFGCDICNEVCPWNERFAAPSRTAEFRPRDVPRLTDAEYFQRMSELEFHELFWDTPLGRAGLTRLRRNAATALANAGGPGSAPAGGDSGR